MEYIVIDLGSSFIKAAVFDADRLLLHDVAAIASPPFLEPDHPCKCENDIERILQIVTDLIGKLARGRNVAGLFFSTQMHGFILTRDDGKPYSPFISWQDTRSLQINLETGKSFLTDYMDLIPGTAQRKTGNPAHAGPSAYTLYAMRQRGEFDGRGKFFTLGDYLAFRLSGGHSKCHLTQAAATGLVDLETGDWNRSIIEAIGLGQISFPEICSESKAIAMIEIEQNRIPIYPAIGDQQAAMAGALAQPGKDLIINIGTGAQVGRIETGLEFGDYELRPYFGATHLRTFSRLPGGRALHVLSNFFVDVVRTVGGKPGIEPAEIWKTLNPLELKETNLHSDVSFFGLDGKNAGGKIWNITERNLTVGDLLKSAFDDMAENYFKYGTRLGRKIERVLCMGGISARSAALRQSIAKRFGTEVRTAPFGEDTLAGLARIALVVSGRCRDFEEAGVEMKKLVVKN